MGWNKPDENICWLYLDKNKRELVLMRHDDLVPQVAKPKILNVYEQNTDKTHPLNNKDKVVKYFIYLVLLAILHKCFCTLNARVHFKLLALKCLLWLIGSKNSRAVTPTLANQALDTWHLHATGVARPKIMFLHQVTDHLSAGF